MPWRASAQAQRFRKDMPRYSGAMTGVRWFPLRPLASLIAAALGAIGTAEAQEAVRPTSSAVLERPIHQGQVLEQYVVQIMSPLRAADVAGDGLDAGDLDARRQAREAQQRAQDLSQVMRFDLNGDLAVGPEEVAKVNGTGADRDSRHNELERYDVDGDGSVTVKEVLEASARISRVNRARRDDEVEALMALPEARDGRLTAAELADAAHAVFARADSDGDGRISRDEAGRFHASLPPEPRREPVEDVYCAMPQAEASDLIVVFGSYEGEYARATGVPQTGRATVHVEPGRQPIYLILPSYRAIHWTLTGAVGRVRRVVVTSYDEAEKDAPRGADGLPPQRVRAFGSQGCVGYFHKLQTPEADAAKAAIVLSLGRPPDLVAGAYAAGDITLPPPPPGSVTPRQRPEAAGPPMRPGNWRFNDEAGALPTLVVRDQEVTRLIFRVGDAICMAKFRWRREGRDAWRFQSQCGSGESEQVAEGRAVGDFQTSLAFTARVVNRGFKDPALNGETTVRVQAQYVEPSP
jgi:Ca2+-binding EF-hand superfamily protein